LSGSHRLGWTTFGARGAALVIRRGAAGNDRDHDDPAGHRGRQALLHWQVQLAAWMHMLLPPGISCPGEHEACLSPQLTSHPPQLPLGADLAALHLLFLPGGGGTTGMPIGITAIAGAAVLAG
jgi:hypothetical protein